MKTNKDNIINPKIVKRNKWNKKFADESQYKKVVYMVTSSFGLSPKGELRYAYLIAQEGTTKGLLFHPAEPGGENAVMEVGVFNDRYWVSHSEDSYVNLE